MIQFAANSLFAFVIVACTACSFFLLFKPTRFFHVTHGVCILCAAYASVWLANVVGLPLLLALPLAVGIASLVGFFIFGLFGLVGGPDRPVFVLMVSIGVAVVFQNAFSILFGDQVVRLAAGSTFDDRLQFQGVSITVGQLLILLLGLLAICGMTFLWYGTGAGRNARAISDDGSLAVVVGVPVGPTLGRLAVASSAGAGVTGVMAVLDTGVNPASGFGYLLPGLIAAVISGGSGIRAVLVAAAIVSGLSSFAAYFIGTKWSNLSVYLLLAVFLVLRPTGIESAASRVEEER